MKRTILSFSVLMFLWAGSVMAAPMEGGPKDVSSSNGQCVGTKIASGKKDKGYSNLYENIARVCGQKVALCEVQTKGGLDNLNALAEKKADLALVQLDTYMGMKEGNDAINALQLVLPLNSNYLHPITATAGFQTVGEKRMGILPGAKKQLVMTKFSDFKGQYIALVGSAAFMVRKLNDVPPGLGMTFKDVATDEEAFKLVQSGEVAGALTLSGWPSGTVKILDTESKLTIVPFDMPVNNPFRVKQVSYKGIAVYNVNALSVPNVLVTRQFTGKRAENVAALKQCIVDNLDELKQGDYEPGWNEITDLNQTYGMPVFKAPTTTSK